MEKKKFKPKHKRNRKSKHQKKQKYSNPKKEKEITKLSQITHPVEKRIPKCENCEKKISEFYCPMCQVYYCSKCEEQMHKISVLKKHKNHLYKAPYNELTKKYQFNVCEKHNKELTLFCSTENKLICEECHDICIDEEHRIISLNKITNKISEKMEKILKEIQKEENENYLKIQKILGSKKKLKNQLKEMARLIENKSDLLKKKIEISKLKHLELLNKIKIIIDNKYVKIMIETEKKQKKINKDKFTMKNLEMLKKEGSKIQLIQESKKIIEREEAKGEDTMRIQVDLEEEEEEEEFDSKMNQENKIQLKNKNKTAYNPGNWWGAICGKKVYSRGKHEIRIRIDQFPKPGKYEYNQMNLGVVKTKDRENLIQNNRYGGIYYFRLYWDEDKKQAVISKRKKEMRKWTEKKYTKKITLKKNDILTIFLDMDKKKIYFKINETNLGVAWRDLPEKVNFFAILANQEGEEKNQISLI
ncbi:tripartite motif-containing protein [Anaeramoeba flamelloides]|uniref:Tripartite motif-containing protein n=1 Tax=Anaeramoeba flamelloides TaxID=1746091 RepID=A0ABQ8ZFG7_9EUKA|nr:tripartite motif-containing protein [Anaeramoeba flamelloides]